MNVMRGFVYLLEFIFFLTMSRLLSKKCFLVAILNLWATINTIAPIIQNNLSLYPIPVNADSAPHAAKLSLIQKATPDIRAFAAFVSNPFFTGFQATRDLKSLGFSKI